MATWKHSQLQALRNVVTTDRPAYRSFTGWRKEWLLSRIPMAASSMTVRDTHENPKRKVTRWTIDGVPAATMVHGETIHDMGVLWLPTTGGPLFSSPEMVSLWYVFVNCNSEEEFLEAVNANAA